MRRRVWILLGLVLVLGVGVSQGEWRMRIHKGGSVEEHEVAEIDSLTFYEVLGPQMVMVPAGVFVMGSPTDEPCHEGDEIQHEVTLTRALYVGETEVTQAQWLATMGWNESYFSGPNRPVETITWYDALSYCNLRSVAEGFTPAYTISDPAYQGVHITSAYVTWDQDADGYRLLTEAEWEYACRAGSMTAFCNGGIDQCGVCAYEPNLSLVGWYCWNAGDETQDVAQQAPNDWGLYDMHGNVNEWCWDRYGSYTGPVTDPTGPAEGSFRVFRGGCWTHWAMLCRSAKRHFYFPTTHDGYIGLRPARTVF